MAALFSCYRCTDTSTRIPPSYSAAQLFGGDQGTPPTGAAPQRTATAWLRPEPDWCARRGGTVQRYCPCLLYTSDAADDLLCVDLGGRRIIKKKKKKKKKKNKTY